MVVKAAGVCLPVYIFLLYKTCELTYLPDGTCYACSKQLNCYVPIPGYKCSSFISRSLLDSTLTFRCSHSSCDLLLTTDIIRQHHVKPLRTNFNGPWTSSGGRTIRKIKHFWRVLSCTLCTLWSDVGTFKYYVTVITDFTINSNEHVLFQSCNHRVDLRGLFALESYATNKVSLLNITLYANI